MFDLPKFGDGVCLARLAALLDVLAIDRGHLARTSVVVTGSNGKGSTAAFCAAIARAYGLHTGLFTSPHLFRVNERFQVDGVPIADDHLRRLGDRVEKAVADVSRRSGEKFGAFEAMFTLACLYFQESDCEFAVFEAGIGGRYDPVRLVGSTTACVTSVDYEHVDLLGRSLQLIVSDKSDACADAGTIIYGENCRSLRPHILEYNRNRAIASLFVRGEIAISGETLAASSQSFDFAFGDIEYRSLEIALPGVFQLNNAAIAAALFLCSNTSARGATSSARIEAAVRSGLRETRWPGRLETISRSPLTVIDVGHTPDGVRQALAGLKQAHGAQDWILVVGVSFDKKIDEIAGTLAPSFDTIICTSAHHKGADASAVAAIVRGINPKAEVLIAERIEDAFDKSRALAASLHRGIYVAGGLFTAVEYAAVASGGRATDLAFL